MPGIAQFAGDTGVNRTKSFLSWSLCYSKSNQKPFLDILEGIELGSERP